MPWDSTFDREAFVDPLGQRNGNPDSRVRPLVPFFRTIKVYNSRFMAKEFADKAGG